MRTPSPPPGNYSTNGAAVDKDGNVHTRALDRSLILYAEHEFNASTFTARVIAGTGSNNTAEALEYTRHAKAAGADAALIVVPYYNKPTQDGLYAHFKTIAKAVATPTATPTARPAGSAKPGTAAPAARIATNRERLGLRMGA